MINMWMINIVKYVSYLLVLPSTMTSSLAWAETDLFERALAIRDEVHGRLAACDTEAVDPDDPRLPRPRVDAHLALVNFTENHLFGYYHREGGYSGRFTWKRPNGGSVAWVGWGGDDVLWVGHGRSGTVARIRRYFTPAGEHFNYWCRSRRVTSTIFGECLEHRFYRPLLQQFCL